MLGEDLHEIQVARGPGRLVDHAPDRVEQVEVEVGRDAGERRAART